MQSEMAIDEAKHASWSHQQNADPDAEDGDAVLNLKEENDDSELAMFCPFNCHRDVEDRRVDRPRLVKPANCPSTTAEGGAPQVREFVELGLAAIRGQSDTIFAR